MAAQNSLINHESGFRRFGYDIVKNSRTVTLTFITAVLKIYTCITVCCNIQLGNISMMTMVSREHTSDAFVYIDFDIKP